MTLRGLNSTLLTRQMLLERKRVPAARAVSRLVALQAQYAPSPYVALWSRVAGFRKEQLTDDDAILKAATLRTTLHVMARDDYPFIASAAIDSWRGRTENLGVDIEALRRALPRRPLASAEMQEVAERALGTDDRWTIAFALRALPFVRVGVVGPWPHTKPPPSRFWEAQLPDPQEGATRVVRAYLAAYGPATLDDIEHFTNFRKRQIRPALEGLPDRDGMFDVPRAPVASGRERAPVIVDGGRRGAFRGDGSRRAPQPVVPLDEAAHPLLALDLEDARLRQRRHVPATKPSTVNVFLVVVFLRL